MPLAERVAVITGGASGIGRATALTLARRGADLVIADLDERGGQAVAREVRTLGRRALSLRTNVADESDLAALVGRVQAEFGRLDVFYGNAGVVVRGDLDLPIERWRWLFEVNLWAHVHAVRHVLPVMLAAGSGTFVLMASAAGLTPAIGSLPYTVSKFAVVGLAEHLAVILRPRGIQVSVVCPLFVRTPLHENSRVLEEARRGKPLDESAAPSLLQRDEAISPEQVATAIADGIEAGTFLILPNPEVRNIMASWSRDPERYIRRLIETQGYLTPPMLAGS